jgi:hypothetical protein
VTSSIYTEGNPIGFQRWVNADNARGMVKNKTGESAIPRLFGNLTFIICRYYCDLESSYNFDKYLKYYFLYKRLI